MLPFTGWVQSIFDFLGIYEFFGTWFNEFVKLYCGLFNNICLYSETFMITKS